ncbi:hypothetical protein [Pararhodobacter sp. SW119]|uniref:hypothetical protein n=1 Tax=Pararhodobacter sp. SW119 TaxID=2780075 RepID=UPI001AE08F12|nr:hypothetical protein [Pararhodobacter sp. SW119]
MRRIVFVFLLTGLPSLAHAQVTFPVSIAVDIDGTEIHLPGEARITSLSLLTHQAQVRVPLRDLVYELEALAAHRLQGEVRFRGLELSPWQDGGLAVKLLLRLSCLNSNASVQANLRPQLAPREISVSVTAVEVNVSNDLCRLAGDALGLTRRVQDEVVAALEEALADAFRLPELPTPFSALPMSLEGLAFEGANRSLILQVDGIIGVRPE